MEGNDIKKKTSIVILVIIIILIIILTAYVFININKILQEKLRPPHIKIFYIGDFSELELDAISNSVQQMLDLMPNWEIITNESNQIAVETAAEKSKKRTNKIYGEQIDANSLIENVKKSKVRKYANERIVVFTTYGLYKEDYSFLFGLSSPKENICINSLSRYRELPEYEQELGIEWVVRHELGHLGGLIKTGRSNSYEKGGTHCSNYGCTMGQAWTLQELQARVYEIEKMESLFCSQCIKDLK